MSQRSRGHGAWAGALRALIIAIAALTALPTSPAVAQEDGADDGLATIVVASFAADGVTPLAFVRFQVTDSNGTIYGPLESAPGTGVVRFRVDPVDAATTFTVAEETPPACGIAPDPLVVGPLAAGEEVGVEFQTEFLADCELGSIAAYKLLCPAGFTTTATDYATYRDACTEPVDGALFAFRQLGGDGQQWQKETGAHGIPGRAPLVGLPPGDYLVQEQVDPVADPADQPAGPIVFCLVYGINPAEAPEPTEVYQAQVTDGGTSVALDNQRIACDFFYVPGGAPVPDGGDGGEEPDGGDQPDGSDGTVDEPGVGHDTGQETGEAGIGTGSIELHKSVCPAGYEDGNYFGDCHWNGAEGVDFYVSGPDGYNAAETTVLLDDPDEDPGPGVARFTELAGGDYLVYADVPADGTSRFVYCSRAESEELVPFVYTDDGGIIVSLGDGINAICDWYTIPDQQFAPARIEVVKYLCPPDYDFANAAPGAPYSDCAIPGAGQGVAFELSRDGGAPDRQGTGSDGKVRYDDLSPGTYALFEDVPLDGVTPYAFCSVDGGAAFVADIQNGTTYFAIDGSGQRIVCDWFNVPEDLSGGAGAGVLTIHSRLCPAGYDGGDYFDACHNEPLADITYDAAGPAGHDASATTGPQGLAFFEQLEGGTYTVYQEAIVSPTIAEYVVYCSSDGDAGRTAVPFEYLPPDGGRLGVRVDLPAGVEVICDWYNVPADLATRPATLAIHKAVCPPGFAGGDYFEACHEETLGGVTFEANGPGSNDFAATTGQDGVAFFDELAAGTYTITELPPPDTEVAVYVVYCSDPDGRRIDFDYDDATGLRIRLKISRGAEVTCDWYNVPPQPGPSGSITVLKFLCQGRTDNDYDWEEDCSVYGAGAGFELQTKDGQAIVDGETDAAGRLRFFGLADGAYGLEETTGDWCRAEADRVDAAGNVQVVNGGNTDVFVYNCTAKRTVTTLPSTGAGPPAAGAAGAGRWSFGGGLLGLAALFVVRRARPVTVAARA